ncbi:MAG: amidohydrolase family protein [Solirubrobacteraceae bacterium]
MDLAEAFEPVRAELGELLPDGAIVVDAHTHLGRDEDGQSLDLGALIAFLDQISPAARAVTFALHDPERVPAYQVPNGRVLAWAAESNGRLYPYCRLDPGQDPVREAQRCLALGARGIKLHPRAQAFGFGDAAAESIWRAAQEASVPILIHAGRGMPPMDSLAGLALRYPDVVLVLAHAAIADQGMFASRLAEHPNALFDTATFSVFDQLELFARVPAERIVFASDVPYGRPVGALYTALRIAAYAGLGEGETRALVGGTMLDVLEGRPLAKPRAPRVPEIRPTSGRLARVNAYVLMSFAAALGSGPPPDFGRSLPFIAMARAACRDPDPGPAGPALERIDKLLSAAELLVAAGGKQLRDAAGLVMSAGVIAATEPFVRNQLTPPDPGGGVAATPHQSESPVRHASGSGSWS